MTNVFSGTSRTRRVVSLGGMAVVVYTVATSTPRPGTSGAGLAVLVLTLCAAAAWAGFVLAGERDARIAAETLLVAGAAGAVLMSVSARSGAAVIPFVAVFAAARELEAWAAGAVGIGTFAALAASAAPAGRSVTTMLGISAGLFASHLGGRAIREYIEGRERAELSLAQMQVAREEQARSAALAERARIAREIHDVLAHSLSALAVQLEGTRMLLAGGGNPAAALENVEQARGLARRGLDETRQAIGALRGDAVPTLRLIERLVDEARAGGDAFLDVLGTPRALPADAALTVYRVAEEAVTNARRHAPGSGVAVQLRYADAEVTLRVANDGTRSSANGAGTASRGGGYGLVGMRERAELLGGTLQAGPDGDGWCVELAVPA